MRKLFLATIGLIVLNSGWSQTKLINPDSQGLFFKIEKNTIDDVQFDKMTKHLEADFLNSDFKMLDANTLVFKRKLVGQTRLNTVQNNLQNQINVYEARLDFADLNKVSEVFFDSNISTGTYYVAGLSNAMDEDEIEKALLKENKIGFVEADYLTHQVYVIYDVNLGEEIVKEILQSKDKRVIQSDEISKYY